MHTFETIPGEANPIEVLKDKLSQLKSEAGELEERILESGENIDVELGSEEYVDFGYTEALRAVNLEIETLEKQLSELDDQKAAQRNLAL
jgi:prefoldin subunit 5